ncbi:hypothetical protein [Streptomyces spororaveus]|uniref:hypothetical protein n=1 Tax=Streptomyces spororaveus TaxID=284039 RepID=UPI00378BCAD1
MVATIPISNVRNIGHMGFESTSSSARRTVEIYTGWVDIGVTATANAIVRSEFATFLPVSDETVIRYTTSLDALLSKAVVASPTAVSDADDEANLGGVDTASVELEEQSIPEVAGHPLCLVLRATLSFHHVTIHNFNYQVTLLWQGDIGKHGEFLDLDSDERPSP